MIKYHQCKTNNCASLLHFLDGVVMVIYLETIHYLLQYEIPATEIDLS